MNIVAQRRVSKAGDTGTGVFLKFIMMGSVLTQADIVYILDMIEYLGKDINPEKLQPEVRPSAIDLISIRYYPFGNQPEVTKTNKHVAVKVYSGNHEPVHPGLSGPGSDLDLSTYDPIPNALSSDAHGHIKGQTLRRRTRDLLI